MSDLNPNLHYLSLFEGSGGEHFPADEQAILDNVNQKVAAKASLSELMDFLFDAVQEIYPCDRIGLAFLDDDGRRLVAHWSKATYTPILLNAGYGEDLSHSSLKSVIESGTSRIIYDLARYEEEHPRSASTRLLVREGVRSSMSCPLKVEDRISGVIFLSSREPKVYTPYHSLLWRALAERISQAVEKAWRIEQLTLANQAYNEMLAFVSHELKNPVASMMTDARLLVDGYLGDLEPLQKTKLERLIKKGDYLLDLIREYLDLARMEGGSLRLNAQPTNLVDEVLEPAFDLVQAQFQERNMRLERDYPQSPEPVECDGNLLKVVLVNLLGNAVKYGNEGGLVRLHYDQWPGRFMVSVRNEGPGFPPEERPRLFRKFSRLQSPELKARKGTGVGLYTSWRIVHLHGGRMDATSHPGAWAEFSLEIPQPLIIRE
ncbi:MAG: GAF domain-containing sensor histidine kinase [Firmicutes bacterium]|nr:GAF domain-containing sensor histidine kinase [Bacillota bacterium]